MLIINSEEFENKLSKLRQSISGFEYNPHMKKSERSQIEILEWIESESTDTILGLVIDKRILHKRLDELYRERSTTDIFTEPAEHGSISDKIAEIESIFFIATEQQDETIEKSSLEEEYKDFHIF